MRIEKSLRRIADTYLNIIIKEDAIEAAISDVDTIIAVFAQVSSLRQFLANDEISPAQKKEVLHSAFEGKITPFTLGLLDFLVDSGLSRKVFRVIFYLDAKLERIKNSYRAEIISALELSEELKEKLISAVKKAAPQSRFFEVKQDPSLIGGVIIRIGDRLFDGSVKGRLEKFKKAVSKRQ